MAFVKSVLKRTRVKLKSFMNGLCKLTFNCLSLRVKRSNLFSAQYFLRLLRSMRPRNDNFIGFSPIIILLLVISLIMISCEKKTSKITGEKSLNVITTLFPLYDFAKNIGKKKADVTLLLPPGVESHSFDPKPGDILRIHEADIFVYTGKFMEPWVEDVLKGIGDKGPLIIDSSRSVILTEDTTETEHNPKRLKMDPHIWLDFSKARKMVDNILEGFIKRDPEHRQYHQTNPRWPRPRTAWLVHPRESTLSSCKKD